MRLEQFLYLFVMDPVLLPYEEFPFQYPDYEKREPGYSQSWLKAYNYAFQAPKDGKITRELLFGIHQRAMSFQGPDVGGKYRHRAGNFRIGPAKFHNDPDTYSPHFSGSNAGLREFIDYWFKSTPINKHLLSFSNKATKESFAITSYHNDKIKWLSHSPRQSNSCANIWLDLPDAIKRIEQLFGDTNCSCSIDVMPSCEDALIPDEVEIELQRIIDGFDEEITLPDSDKIRVIAKYIQRINQLHPFIDGNIRTCYILLNKLLRDYDLPLCILLNPNRLDACSISELVELIKKGQVNYQRLLKNQEETFTFEPLDETRPIIATPLSLIDVDVETVTTFLEGLTTEPLPSIVASAHTLFAPKLSYKALLLNQLHKLLKGDEKYQSLIAAIEGDNFSAAFRKACHSGTPPIIRTIFNFQKVLAIDMQESSTNGKTAYDWLKENTTISPRDKDSLLVYFENFARTESSFTR